MKEAFNYRRGYRCPCIVVLFEEEKHSTIEDGTAAPALSCSDRRSDPVIGECTFAFVLSCSLNANEGSIQLKKRTPLPFCCRALTERSNVIEHVCFSVVLLLKC